MRRLVVDSSVMYVALAKTLSTRAVTADCRLYNALQSGPFARPVL
jgi:predicted nucleic acid-binding protein